MNGRQERVDIITPVPAVAVVDQDTFPYVDNRIRLRVRRSDQPLKVRILTGNFLNEYEIAPKNSFAFWLNIWANYGLGMLVDQFTQKRFSYPSRVYVNPLDPSRGYQLWHAPVRNQDLALKIYIPYLNLFHLRPDEEPDIKSSAGFWGIGAGLDFYHQPNQFMAFDVSVQTNFYVPVPAAVDIEGEFEFVNSQHFSFTNNHRLRRLALGYGVSFSHNVWEFQSAAFGAGGLPTRPPVRRSNTTIGLAFPVHFYTGKSFYLRTVYRPSFWRFSDLRPLAYEHLFSLGFGWDIWL